MTDDAPRPLPLVSVVTPSYNHAHFIRDTIESVVGQDYPVIEYLVLDGGSSDGTVDILRDYEDHLTWWSEPDRGPVDAINRGWGRARGDILLWVNSDDVLLPGAISAAVAVFRADPAAVGVYGSGTVIDAQGGTIGEWSVPTVDPVDVLYWNDPFLQPATFVRAEVARQVGPLDERYEWVFDWDFFLRVLEVGHMARVDQDLAAWRQHGDTRTQTGGHRRIREMYRMLRRHGAPIWAPSYRVQAAYTCLLRLDRFVQHRSRLVRALATRASTAITSSNLFTELRGGRYQDGWAAPRVRYFSESPGSELHVRGAVDQRLYPPLRGQAIRVWVGGRMVSEATLPDGEFDLVVPLTSQISSAPRRVELRATKWFVPHRIGLSADRRRLAYHLHSIDVT